MNTRILTKKNIKQLINMEDCCRSAEEAYKIYSSRNIVQPPILSFDIPAHNGEVDIKSGYNISDDVIQYIASNIKSNIRELEGSLTRLVAFSTLHKRPIDVALCEEALKEVFEQKAPRRVDENVVMSAVSDYYGVTPEDLKSSRRNREITVPRQVAMYLTREMTGLSLPSIGRAFGGRDHSTVLYACNTVEKNLKTTPSMAALVEDIRKLIREGK